MDSQRKADLAGRPLGGSFTIPEWCRHRRVSISMYYKLRAQGRAPATLDVGRHKTITAEADAAWVRERQAASIPGNPITSTKLAESRPDSPSDSRHHQQR
jgi:hypothetical protein